MDYSEPLDLSLPSVKMKNKNQSCEADMPLDLSKKRTDNPHILQTGPFTNTNINNISNFNSDKRPGMHQTCGSSSMPFLNSPKPRTAHSCIPVRNKYSDNYEEEFESSEEPFDFSYRYSETQPSNSGQKMSGKNCKGKKSKSSNESFTIYAETDLDQPTDYSLRYAENDSDSDSEVCDNAEKTATAEFVGDTVKTYCTEGTPYETPFNFSTSTSMSDLRISEKNATGTIDIQGEKSKIEKNIPEDDMEPSCSKENTAESENHQPQTPKLKSEFNSGLTSPEKPMNYCDEGTPGYFSRVSSFGSLNSAAAGSGEEKLSEEKDKCEQQNVTPKGDKMQQKMPGSEVKVVKFENIVNYCEETPLMFSRSSSLGSLDSIEQHSMHDDRSSVISDFSRLTSGIISPSEIPDSPTQTVPPSPKQRKSSDFGIINRNSSIENRRHPSARRSLPTKSSIFEDDVTKFKEESTPAQFSVATSLSSLTIDDNDDTHVQDDPEINNGKDGCSSKQDVDPNTGNHNLREERNSFRHTRDNVQNRCFSLSGSGKFPSNRQDSPNAVYNANTSSFPSRVLPSSLPAENTSHIYNLDDTPARIYNTEDTPAVLSHNGSISELSLSTLSMLDEEPGTNRVYLSENSSESSGGRGQILTNKEESEVSASEQEMKDVWVRREDSALFRDHNLPPFIASRDECSQFAVEDSPAQFSLRSSLSHLTIESEVTSGIQEFLPKATNNEPPRNMAENPPKNSPEEKIEDSVDGVDAGAHEEHSNTMNSSAISVTNQELEGSILNGERSSINCDSIIEENADSLCDNTKSYELKLDDSRCNSIKKRKWKWKWQFASEDSHQSESGESTPTDRQSCSNNEEFDQGRRTRVDKNNSGSLDASFRKKKWWKWKFGSKEKETSGTTPETTQNCFVDDDKSQKSNSLVEKEPDLKDGVTVDTRNKSKRWKWKWKLNFKDEENSKTEKFSLGLSKLKQHVSPENTREPLSITELPQSSDLHKEMNPIVKFVSEEHSKPESKANGTSRGINDIFWTKNSEVTTNFKISPNDGTKHKLQEQMSIPVREKLDTPEASDSEHSVIFEEVIEHNLYENNGAFSNRNSSGRCSTSRDIHPTDLTENKGENISGSNSNYAALLEECIQLGMPKKINTPDKTPHNNSSSGSRCSKMNEPDTESDYKKEQCNVSSSRNTAIDRMAILEECIQMGVQKKNKESIVNKYVEDNVNSPKTNYKTVNQKGSANLFMTNKSFDVMSMKDLKMQGTRNMTDEHSAEKLPRAKSTNFDSSSLNRLSLLQPRRNDFISNDNILKNIPNESLGKLDHSDRKKTLCNAYCNGGNPSVNCSKIHEQVMSSSQLKNHSSSNRAAFKNPESKSSNSKALIGTRSQFPSENQLPMVSKNVSKVPLQTKVPTKSDTGKNPDFAALIEECIQLGMPKRRESSEEALSPTPLSPSLMGKKPISAKGWPEYLCRVASDNRSASLPKKSSAHLTSSQSYCVSNEDFTAAEPHAKRNMVIQNSFDRNLISRTSINNGFKSDIPKNKTEKIGFMPPKTRYDTNEFEMTRANNEHEESLYANADETRSYLSQPGRPNLHYSYKSPSPKRSPISQYESKKGTSSDEENNAALIEDCVRLGVPVKKLQELRRSLDRSRSGTPRIGDSEDGAVYANTTERYSTFRSSARSDLGASRNGENPISYNDSEDAHSPILSGKKFVPNLASNKSLKNNLPNNDSKSKSIKTDSYPESKNNQDFAAIIEECIQLGMPKRKEFSRETLNSNLSLTSINSRSNSVSRCTEDLPKVPFEFNRSATLPKGSTYLSSPQNCYSSSEDFGRTGSLKKTNLATRNTPPNIRKSSTPDQLNLSKKDPVGAFETAHNSFRSITKTNNSQMSSNLEQVERVPRINRDAIECVSENTQQPEEPEESLYVNVSKHVGYSKSTRKQQHLLTESISPPTESTNTEVQSTFKNKDTNNGEPNYSALVEDCIQLGMPSKKVCDIQNYQNGKNTQIFPKQTRIEVSEMPDDSDSEDVAIYANTSERYSTFKSSMPQPGLNRSSRVMKTADFKSSATSIQVGESEVRKANITSSNTMIEKALEECIQLGWPKKREIDKNTFSKTLNTVSNDASVKRTDKSTPKNVNVASVARNMQNHHLTCSKVLTLVTGAREDSELQDVSMIKSDKEGTLTNMERNGFNRTSLNYLSISKNDCFESNEDSQQAESEISFAGLADIDVKLLDPRLVLESLEKYTAKLISEAESRLNKKVSEV